MCEHGRRRSRCKECGGEEGGYVVVQATAVDEWEEAEEGIVCVTAELVPTTVNEKNVRAHVGSRSRPSRPGRKRKRLG